MSSIHIGDAIDNIIYRVAGMDRGNGDVVRLSGLRTEPQLSESNNLLNGLAAQVTVPPVPQQTCRISPEPERTDRLPESSATLPVNISEATQEVNDMASRLPDEEGKK